VAGCFESGNELFDLREVQEMYFHCYTVHVHVQRPTTATNHIQQNQNDTPNAVTGSLFS
jgi:hypothetical protein